MTRVAHFNTYPHGGASVAARRMCESQLARGLNAKLYWSETEQGEPEDPLFQRLPVIPAAAGGLLGWLQRPARRMRRRAVRQAWDSQVAPRDPSLETFSIAEQYHPKAPDWSRIGSDLVHLHWIAFLADWPAFFQAIPDRVPIVWTMHDANPFTGGCHFTGGCERFSSGCGNCPQLVNSSMVDASRRTHLVKQNALRRRRIHVVSPSQWAQDLARESSIWPASTSFSVVHYGLPLHQFEPLDKSECRQQLGIDPAKTVIGFGADNLLCERKGFRFLVEALGIRAGLPGAGPLTGLLMGSGAQSQACELESGLEKVVQLGFLGDERSQARFYSACDLIVVPSLEDNQPQMALEAMACGTPVVAFAAGGIPEFVQDGITGKLAGIGNASQLAGSIQQLVGDPELRRNLGQRARMLISREFEMHAQADRYLGIYQHLLSERARRAA